MLQDNSILGAQVDAALDHWRQEEKQALELLRIVGELRFDRSIELVFFRRDIYDARPSTVLNFHRLAENYSDAPLQIEDSLLLAQAIHRLDAVVAARVDLGKLALEWREAKHQNGISAEAFIGDQLGHLCGVEPLHDGSRDVVLYGFGRIGRLVARRLITSTGRGEQLRLKAIVIRPKLKDRFTEASKRASLLASDSVHGEFHGMVEVSADGHELIVNGNRIQLIFAGKPADIDYRDYGINGAVLIDNTGVWRDREGLSEHLRPGIAKVLLTAPAKGDIPNIVYGVNSPEDRPSEQIFSAASCTTNAIAPVIDVVERAFGIEQGHIETIHAYTNDQNLLDNFHKKPRRGRGAPINMVLTSTGAATAVAKVLPQLAGKLTGNAIRVPTPNVSLAVLNLSLKTETDAKSLNEALREAALYGDLVEQIQYSTSTEYVSSNAVGNTCTSVLDAPSTIVSADGKQVVLYVWYDNEYGYTCQVVRLAKHIAGARRYRYY
ncbi:MAG: glyceraldehyde-3-phosphate dehydrogenase [Bacteroidota bacterium]